MFMTVFFTFTANNLGVFLCRCLCSEIVRSGEDWKSVVEGAHRLTGIANRVHRSSSTVCLLHRQSQSYCTMWTGG